MICLWKQAERELPKNRTADDLLALNKICHEKCPRPCGAENDTSVITYSFLTYEQYMKIYNISTITGYQVCLKV
jgi:hypothetical protein